MIYWGDGTGISNQDQIGRSYAPKGQSPVVARSAERVTQSMISAVSNRGLMRFMLDEGALNADGFIAFLRRLTKDAGQKVVLIVDNLKVHKADKVQAWVERHARPRDRALPPARLCARPQPERVPEQRPEAAAAPAAAARLKEELIGRTRSIRAAHRPALAGARPDLLQARARPLRRVTCPG